MQVKPAAEIIPDLVSYIQANCAEPLLILVSGGSLFAVLQKSLHQLMMLKLDLTKVSFSLIDERFGEKDEMNTNFCQLQMLHEVMMLEKQGAKFVPILQTGLDLTATAEHYEKFLQLWAEGPNKKMLGIFGLGPDFHTAGILPHKPEFSQQFYEKLAVGYKLDDISDSDNKFRSRVTLSFKGMQLLSDCWVYAVGTEKQAVVSELKQELGKQHFAEQVAQKPGLFLTTLKEISIYTDLSD